MDNSMNHKKIAIIGGGLSGLYAAYLLEKSGITDYILLEARDDIGGRISDFSFSSGARIDRFDLGPTWFWPENQPQLDAVISSFNLKRFAQYEQGNIVVERTPNTAPTVMQGYLNSPTSMRLKGGMCTLIHEISSALTEKQISVSSRVNSIQKSGDSISVSYIQHEKAHTVEVEHVFLAVPPRLALHLIQFTPALPDALHRQWQKTETWMAAHAKYIAIYDKPFWKEKGLSGSARSAYGPMVEIHDASMPDGKAALFGFLGIPANHRKTISEGEMKVHCRTQMVRLFGSEASMPDADIIKDWSQDPFTATPNDLNPSGSHGHAPQASIKTGPWQQNLTGIGSEWSVQFPGYIAGAIEAASHGIKQYLESQNHT